jgi:hypothetical protein
MPQKYSPKYRNSNPRFGALFRAGGEFLEEAPRREDFGITETTLHNPLFVKEEPQAGEYKIAELAAGAG